MIRPKILYIFRGLPGSGKSTEARKIGCIVVEPQDNWSTRDGQYNWIKEEAKLAATKSAILTELLMQLQYDIAIAEVLPRFEDLDPFLNLARKYGYTPKITDLKITIEEALERNNHDVPREDFEEYMRIWEDYSI